MEPKDYHFKLPIANKPTNIRLPEVWYPGIKQHWAKCTTKRIYNPIFGVKGIIIHATAGHSSDGAVSVMRAGKASWHWLVPDEDEAEHGNIIWACAPETLAAWHVRNSVSHPEVNEGKNKTNHWSLGVELVNSQQQDPFSDWQVKITADIVKYCWAKYPNLEHVVSHAKLDPTRRTDPGINFPWEHFKDLVLGSNFDDMLVFEDFADAKPEVDLGTTVDANNLCH
nr:N-acetylmuramoyl-L-alanine amidase [Allomuricauda sp.]